MPQQNEDLRKSLDLILTAGIHQKHSEPLLLKNYAEYLSLHSYINSTKLLLRGLSETCNNLLNAHVKGIENGEISHELIIGYQQFRTCEEFFKVENKTALDARIEYRIYMLNGHYFAALSGEERELS